MNSPYKGKFKVTQQFKGNIHDGLDLVGLDSKNIYSTVDGVVERAGWENAFNKKQGFGKYVRIKKNNSVDRYYFGHLSALKVKKGQSVKKGDLIGIEGNTGYSFGSHCHYCIRGNASKQLIRDVSEISGIPNKIGTIEAKSKVSYFDKYEGKSVSLVEALNSLKISSNYRYRSKIAKANNIKIYIGSAAQNIKLLNLLKQGKLIKP